MSLDTSIRPALRMESFEFYLGATRFSEMGIRINDMIFKQKSTAECRAQMDTFESSLEARFVAC